MKIQHQGCGGEVEESKTKVPYFSEEYGTVPVYECQQCEVEIVGDAQIALVPESEADRMQIEAFSRSGNHHRKEGRGNEH